MRLQALRQRFVTSTLVQQDFSRTYGFRVSHDTVRRRLAETDLDYVTFRPRRLAPAVSPPQSVYLIYGVL
jgi:hypothetical protein